MARIITCFIFLVVLNGCAGPGYKEFYTQAAPMVYPTPDKTVIFEYPNVNLKEVYNLLFSDFLIIGRSAFNGPYERPERSVSYAQSIGTDVLITTAQFKETRTSFMTLALPASSTTYVSGYSGVGSFYGAATTYGVKSTSVPITVNRYDQEGLFLRNVNNVVPLWQRVEAQYKKTDSHNLEGNWFDETYKLTLYRSGQQIVAFIANDPKISNGWKKGQLKFIYGVDSGVGVYLMSNKAPMPAQFALNKFGHLEVTLAASKETFSFARQ